VGGKALLLKVDEVFRLFVLTADRKLDSAAIKRHFGAKKTRFATAEELASLTGLVPGAVPPFGAPVLPFPLYVDPSVFANERIAFNAGSLTDSIVMAVHDYRRLAGAEVFEFALSGLKYFTGALSEDEPLRRSWPRSGRSLRSRSDTSRDGRRRLRAWKRIQAPQFPDRP
jgi:Ala-tRNA(Pro) deacylase